MTAICYADFVQDIADMRFPSGIPHGTFDSNSAILVAQNYNQDLLDHADYRTYTTHQAGNH